MALVDEHLYHSVDILSAMETHPEFIDEIKEGLSKMWLSSAQVVEVGYL